jgi:UPF0716 family protein affecting phage T7 exclusion
MMLWEKQTARRTRPPPIGLILLAGLIVVPLAELAVLIEIGGWLGLGPTLALIILAGALLLTPGFLSDTAGAILLLPPVRALLYRRVRRRLEEQVCSEGGPQGRDQSAQASAWQDRKPQARSLVIDAEFEEVEPGDMPAPRGSWSRRP